ncbi:MAG: alpha/beta hydrolase [Elusimicrobiota bacterium]|nr:alpha/beta hydrolase [Elusimicrobiota bacterium]
MNGRLQLETLSSLVLKGNPLGDPRRREIPVYLPPSYGTVKTRRYPVLYYLHGFTGTGRGVVNHNPWKENLAERLDRLIVAGKAPEAILVMPDGFTFYGGSQWVNSTATGRYEDHLVDEVVAFIDDKYATVRAPEGRALFGKSSGGFGALSVVMRRPGVFAHAASHSGDMAFDLCYGADAPKFVTELGRWNDSPEKFVAAFRASRDRGSLDHAVLNMVAMASCYSPNAKSKLGFDLPFAPRTGERDEAVWRRWLAFDPVAAAPARVKELKALKTLWFDAGRRDEFHLHIGARRFSALLKKLRVPHAYEEHELGHFDMHERYDRSLALLAARCRRVG